jgi:hypothetical protein
MRIQLGVSPDIDLDTMGAAIDAALEASTIAQVPLIAAGKVPDIRDSINAGKVKWKPEPPGQEHFDDARTVLGRGWGDCDDLAAWHAAGLRATGEDPGARPFVYQSGPRRWHAVVQRSDGIVDDPSRWAGMRKKSANGVQGIGAATVPPMWPGALALGVHPYQYGWTGRVDVPDTAWPITWTTYSNGPTPGNAVVGAIRTARTISEAVGRPDERDVARLCGIEHLICGYPFDVVGDIMGDEVGFLPLIPAAAGLLSGGGGGPLGGILNMAGGLLGGGAHPPAPAAAPAAAPMGGGGGYPMGGGYPIIIRF